MLNATTLNRQQLLFAATSDLAGKVRGKAFPADLLKKRAQRGVGWTPTNVQITCFDAIADSPYGALGDLLLVPDQQAHVHVDFGDGGPPENFMLGDIVDLDGQPWECCTRSILKAALARLREASGLQLVCAFEHEFHLQNAKLPLGGAYTLSGFRARAEFAEAFTAALNAAGLDADTFMKEYGPDQYEVTIAPQVGVRAADAAVALREIARATAERLGDHASFTPIRDPGNVGNGVHVHFSFIDDAGEPASYDPQREHGCSEHAAAFAGGVLKYIDSFLALTAPSAISYLRLTPHRWSAAFNNLGLRDREASLRICPTTSVAPESIARQFNLEYRAADAAASPYLALAAIVHAGTQGIIDGLSAPPATEEDLSLLDGTALAARGLVRLPQSLPQALERFAANDTVRGWFPGQFSDVYLQHKYGELDYLKGMSNIEMCATYEQVY